MIKNAEFHQCHCSSSCDGCGNCGGNCENNSNCGNCNGKCKHHYENSGSENLGNEDVQIINLNGANNSIEDIKADRFTPAVLFETNIYSVNSSYSIPENPNVYHTMIDVDRDIIKNQMVLYEKAEGHKIDRLQMDTIREAYYHMFNIAESNFNASINNCLMVHLANMSRMFDIDGVQTIDFIDKDDLKNSRLLSNNIVSFIASYVAYEKEFDTIYNFIMNGTLDNHVQLHINKIGNDAYFYIRSILDRLLANIMTENQDSLAVIIQEVNSEFCKMMQDLCYEGCVFTYNIRQIIASSPIMPEQLNEIYRNNINHQEIDAF